MIRILLAAACIAASSPAWGAEIYRCRDANGRIEFRDSACDGPAGGKVEVRPNVVSEIDQSTAREAHRRIAERLAARAREEEAADRRARAARAADEAAAARRAAAESRDVPWWFYPGYYAPRRPQPPSPLEPTVAPPTGTIPEDQSRRRF